LILAIKIHEEAGCEHDRVDHPNNKWERKRVEVWTERIFPEVPEILFSRRFDLSSAARHDLEHASRLLSLWVHFWLYVIASVLASIVGRAIVIVTQGVIVRHLNFNFLN
jgi:hypothetical protein